MVGSITAHTTSVLSTWNTCTIYQEGGKSFCPSRGIEKSRSEDGTGWQPAPLTYLKDNGLIVFFEVEGKDVGVHERGTALAEHVNGFLQELDLDPGHVVLLHLLHLLLDLGVQLVLKAQTLHVVHVAVAVEEVPLQGRSGSLCEFPLGRKSKRHSENRVMAGS